MNNRENLLVVCAAVKSGEHLVLGVRHYDMLMHSAIGGSNKERKAAFKHNPLVVQGFVDSRGNFLNRKEALELAVKSGQMGKKKGIQELFSEDLW